MYEVFYNLKAEPFRLSPDHKFCFEHKSYAKARAYMAYAFKRAEGFVMITGRPGTGKTTLIGELVESLSRDKVFTANLVCTQMDADDLLKTVAYSFGIGSTNLDKAELLQRLTILFHRWHREGRRALLIVDEAQDLSPSAMEELRLLTNIQISGQPLLQIFLLGQPELKDLILSPPMEQVHQRIVAATHIDGLEEDETEAYVIHRLLAVGWRGDPAIDRAIFPVIHKFSEGVPRRINLICSRLFLLGSVEQRHAIELEDVRVVISELQAENLAAGTGFSRHDFVDSGPTEWVPMTVESSPGRPEPHLRAVNSEPSITAEDTLVEDTDEAKKKDIPEVVSDSHTASDAIDLYNTSDDLELEWGGNKGSESVYESVSPYGISEMVADPQWQEPEEVEGTFAPVAGNDVEPPSRWKRGIALVSLVIVATVLALFLWAYFSHQENRSTPRNLESRADMGTGNSAAPENPFPAADPTSSDQFGEPVSAPSSRPATVPHDDALPRTTESIEPPVPQGTAVNDTSPDQPPQDAELPPMDAFASADPSPDGIGELLPSAAAAPEAFEQTILVNFDFDSDAILPDSHQALNAALNQLRDQPESLASITGFSDSRGNEDYNLKLSRKRASAVEQYLIHGGIERQRLHVEGRGALTASAKGKHPNSEVDLEPYRIVQIKLTRDLAQ